MGEPVNQPVGQAVSQPALPAGYPASQPRRAGRVGQGSPEKKQEVSGCACMCVCVWMDGCLARSEAKRCRWFTFSGAPQSSGFGCLSTVPQSALLHI